MKNIIKVPGTIAIFLVMLFSFTACGDGNGSGNGINFSVRNDTGTPITNIKVFEIDTQNLVNFH